MHKLIKRDLKVNRFIAKGIDYFIATFVLVCLIYFKAPNLGMLAGVAYILIADGFSGGQSIGKKLVGLKVLAYRGDEALKCSFKHSILRNIVLIPILFSQIFIIGIMFMIIGLLIIAVEAYFVYSDEDGRRIGDVLAGTKVKEILEEPPKPEQ